jgi:predicted amidohydrolase YtcJ
MIRNSFLLFLISWFLVSCSSKKKEANLIIHNAVIYTIDSSFSVQQAMAVKDGKIIETGSNEQILNSYSAKETNDLEGKTVLPGFIDAHCHFLSYGLGLQQVDLVGTKSFEEVIQRVKDFTVKMDQVKNPELKPEDNWIIGRGWDQNDWKVKEYPSKVKFDSLFPNTPLILKRIDGHAALANSAALKLAGINTKTKIEGGELIRDPKGNLTGVLIDNAVDLVTSKIPLPTKEKMFTALLAAQENCVALGLTTVDDAGLMKFEIDAIDELQRSGKLKMRVYAMLSDSAPNYKYYLEKGPSKTGRLNVRSFKFYADGALGSRGACLLENYSYKNNWKGFLLNTQKHFEESAKLMYQKGFQMNTHCIGDSASRLMLYIYNLAPRVAFDNTGEIQKEAMQEMRWRIEHSQVTNVNDFKLYKGVIPSIQPTHATSDMYWAEERLGKERVRYAYAYKDLLNAAGLVALGTDFPVEDISPFKTFYAAVFRKDSKGFPKGGFQMENALTREETIKGMTIWAAYSNFEEKEKGSLEKGKFADFIILDTDLMKCEENDVLQTQVLKTFINGECVYKK